MREVCAVELRTDTGGARCAREAAPPASARCPSGHAETAHPPPALTKYLKMREAGKHTIISGREAVARVPLIFTYAVKFLRSHVMEEDS